MSEYPLEYCNFCKRETQRRNSFPLCFWCEQPYGTSPVDDTHDNRPVVWVCNHYVSFEGELGETRVFDSEDKANAWVADFAQPTHHEWREATKHIIE